MTDPYADIGARPPEPSPFERWYAHYPRKVARGAAEKAFPKALKLATLEELIAGAQRYAKQVAGKEVKYICHPSTWLRAQRWLDEEPRDIAAEAAQGLKEYSAALDSLRRVDLLVTKGIRSGSLDPQDVRLALRLGRITPEQAEKAGFGFLVRNEPA